VIRRQRVRPFGLSWAAIRISRAWSQGSALLACQEGVPEEHPSRKCTNSRYSTCPGERPPWLLVPGVPSLRGFLGRHSNVHQCTLFEQGIL